MTNTSPTYVPRRHKRSEFFTVRGLRTHVNVWGDPSLVTPERPPLVMLHGWMDVGASFQFIVDALAEDRYVLAPDWRGFGLTETPDRDCYWFADYLGDLDTLLDLLQPEPGVDRPFDLVGHSMGANVSMLYVGVRPQRFRRYVNLEGFGLAPTPSDHAPGRYAQWLDDLKRPMRLRSYASVDEVAQRLRTTNPRLSPAKAAWLAPHWSRLADDGRWHILGDPAHKRFSPIPYRNDETLACWKRIACPMMWVEGDETDQHRRWNELHTRAEFDARLAQIANVQKVKLDNAGHMVHHDQPEVLAGHLERFLSAPD